MLIEAILTARGLPFFTMALLAGIVGVMISELIRVVVLPLVKSILAQSQAQPTSNDDLDHLNQRDRNSALLLRARRSLAVLAGTVG